MSRVRSSQQRPAFLLPLLLLTCLWPALAPAQDADRPQRDAGSGAGWLAAPKTQSLCYGWEGDGVVLAARAGELMYLANTDAQAFEGGRSLEVYKTASGENPHACVAWITGLQTGDEVRASIMTLDQSIDGSPSLRIWGHWTQAGGTIDDVVANAFGNPTFSGGADWVELSHTWYVSAEQDGMGLIVEIIPFNAAPFAGSNWVDFLCVTAPDHATIAFPGDEVTEPERQLQILSASISNTTAGADLTVRARVELGDHPLSAVTVYYTVDGGAQQSQVASNTSGDFWDAVLGQFAAGNVVAWRVVATDTGAGEAVWPAGGGTQSVTITEPYVPGVAHKLLITEIATQGTEDEFIEIYNPNDVDVDLSDYYLTDAIHSPGSQYYWRITEGSPSQTTVGGGLFNDFHARFPDGYTLAAGDTLVVSIAGSQAFYNRFGFVPHLELWGTGPAPRMRPVFGEPNSNNSIVGGTTPTLSNASECVVLYYWDGVSKLVTDIDVFFWGTSTSTRFSKTGVTVGGETYQPETAVADQRPFPEEATFDFSYHRIDPDETGQPGPPGNGVDGRDEVGEPFTQTFAIRAYDPARPRAGDGEIGDVALNVPPQTFVPDLETFVFDFQTKPGSETKVRVLDLEGRLVKTLFDSRFDGPAPLQVVWDGRNATFERVRAGMYVIHLQVVERATGKRTIKTAPVVVATRLK